MDQQIRRLDDPMKLFFFGAGQTVVFMLFFVLGNLANYQFTGIAVGIACAWGLGKTGSRYHRFFWKHCLYWFVPGSWGMKWIPESAFRQFLR
jgi:conjugal transfer pilus assembly protein TraL